MFHKKKLGQVFLKDKKVCQQIAKFINEQEFDNLLEIGPGDGSLTQYVRSLHYMAIETDKRLIPGLVLKFPYVNIIHGDFLEFKCVQPNTLLFGNIPYCLSTPIIFKFLKELNFDVCILMVQREFYYSLLSDSSLSMVVMSCCSCELVLHVSNESFKPKPKVQSTVICLRRVGDPVPHFDKFCVYLRVCFLMPRKTLLNNLCSAYPKDKLIELFRKLGLNLKVRGGALKACEHMEIFKNVRVF